MLYWDGFAFCALYFYALLYFPALYLQTLFYFPLLFLLVVFALYFIGFFPWIFPRLNENGPLTSSSEFRRGVVAMWLSSKVGTFVIGSETKKPWPGSYAVESGILDGFCLVTESGLWRKARCCAFCRCASKRSGRSRGLRKTQLDLQLTDLFCSGWIRGPCV